MFVSKLGIPTLLAKGLGFCFVLLFFVVVLRQGLVYLRVVLNSLCSYPSFSVAVMKHGPNPRGKGLFNLTA